MLKAAVLLCAILYSSVVWAQDVITVAVASSYYTKAETYRVAFEKVHDVKVRLVVGSTGRLYNQITQGAPFDVLIAADDPRISLFNKQSKMIGDGYLGIQVGAGLTTSFQALMHADIQTIAIANPQVAPFGTAAKQALVDAHLWKIIQPKLVYTQNAMQASMMVNQALVDAAFVPIQAAQGAMARIPYTAVLLVKNKISQAFFDGLKP